MQKREPAYYRPLKELAKARDSRCFRQYARIFDGLTEEEKRRLTPPDRADPAYVELHHADRRAGCASMDREDNVIAVDGWIHRTYIHGPKEQAVKKKIKAYLTCREVEAWREEHAADIAAVEEKKEQARIRAVRKHCMPRSRHGI